MSNRPSILMGMALGLVWAVGLLWLGVARVNLPVYSLVPTLAFAFLAPGIVFLLMIGNLAAARFFDDRLIDGDEPVPWSRADINQRVLQNTVEQLVLALALWPPIAYLMTNDGPGVAVCLGLGFSLARVAFWVGYHLSPPLRAFGFAATFYPTILALAWAGLRWAF